MIENTVITTNTNIIYNTYTRLTKVVLSFMCLTTNYNTTNEITFNIIIISSYRTYFC